jgi:hypothetical protein
MTRATLRYLAYVSFGMIAIVFWPCLLLYVALGMDSPLSLGWTYTIENIIICTAVPVTAMAFIPYRAMIGRVIDAERNP